MDNLPYKALLFEFCLTVLGPRELAVEIVYDFTYGDGLVMAGNDDRRACTVQD